MGQYISGKVFSLNRSVLKTEQERFRIIVIVIKEIGKYGDFKGLNRLKKGFGLVRKIFACIFEM